MLLSLSVLKLPNSTRISGVILNKSLNGNKLFSQALNLINVYLLSPFKNEKIQILCDEEVFQCITDEKGNFMLEQPNHKYLNYSICYQGKKLNCDLSYPKNFDFSQSKFYVVCDVDDTIIKSYTKQNIRRIMTLLFTKPKQRKPIYFTKELLNKSICLNGDIFYVSKSEYNLLPIITRAIAYLKIPMGKLFLTDFRTFLDFFPYHKPANYKFEKICNLLESTNTKPFILIGDDTQQDMEVYRIILTKYPDRIAKVYIRQTKSYRSKKNKEDWALIKEANVPCLYFNDDQSIDPEINFLTQTFTI